MRVKEESKKTGLKLSIQKAKIMASSPITSWQIVRETVESVADFIFLDSKITADGDCSCEIKRRLLLGRKAMTNLDSILKSRDITLLTKVRLVKAMVFPVVTYGCESWMVKKAEHRRIDAFELWCWRRLLRELWTARRSNQSILKEISPGCSLEGLMLKLHYSGHLMRRSGLIRKEEKGTTEDEVVGWHHRLSEHEFEHVPEMVKDRWSTVVQRVGHDWVTEQPLSSAAGLACLPPHSQVRADLLGDFWGKKKTCTISECLLICFPFSDPCQHCRLVWSFLFITWIMVTETICLSPSLPHLSPSTRPPHFGQNFLPETHVWLCWSLAGLQSSAPSMIRPFLFFSSLISQPPQSFRQTV